MQILQVRGEDGVLESIKLSNEKLTTELLKNFGMMDTKPKAIPLDLSLKLCQGEGEPLAPDNR